MKTSLILSLPLIVLLLAAQYAMAQVRIEAIEIAWTDSVDARGNYLVKFKDQAPLGNIFFWIKANCNEEAIKALSDNGQLPLRYKWFQKVGTNWLTKGISHPHGNYSNLESDTLANTKTVLTWGKVNKNELRKGKLKISLRLPDDSLITESIIKVY